jgi:hypothetical protein
MGLVQAVGRHEPGHPGADDRDPRHHGESSRVAAIQITAAAE